MLSAEQIDKLRGILVMAGWREVMKPLIEQRKGGCQQLAFLLPSERPDPYKQLDDQTATAILRGEVKALEWVANVFENEVKVYDFNRRSEELATGRNNGGEPATSPTNSAS